MTKTEGGFQMDSTSRSCVLETVYCEDCGVEMRPSEAKLAYNMGEGPEYFCANCITPEKSPDDAAKDIRNIVDPVGQWPRK